MLDTLPCDLQRKIWQTLFTTTVLPHLVQPDGWHLATPDKHYVNKVPHEHTWAVYDAFERKFCPLPVTLVGLKFWGTDAEHLELEIGGMIVWTCDYCARGQLIKPHDIAWPMFAIDYHCVKVICIAKRMRDSGEGRPPECRLSVHYVNQDRKHIEVFRSQRVEIPIVFPSDQEQNYAVFSSGMVGLKNAY